MNFTILMTLNCTWWWGFNSEALGGWGVPLLCHYSRSTLIRSGSTCLGPVYGSNRISVLKMILRCIWWWTFRSEALRDEEYSFFAITSGSTLIRSSSTCLGPVYGSNRISVLKMILKCIWWWTFRSETLRDVEYPIFAITPRFILIKCHSTCLHLMVKLQFWSFTVWSCGVSLLFHYSKILSEQDF